MEPRNKIGKDKQEKLARKGRKKVQTRGICEYSCMYDRKLLKWSHFPSKKNINCHIYDIYNEILSSVKKK